MKEITNSVGSICIFCKKIIEEADHSDARFLIEGKTPNQLFKPIHYSCYLEEKSKNKWLLKDGHKAGHR